MIQGLYIKNKIYQNKPYKNALQEMIKRSKDKNQALMLPLWS